MIDRVQRATPLALVLVLAIVAAAFGGDNAGATFALTSEAEISGVGASETVDVAVSADGIVNAKQLGVLVKVTPADAFDMPAMSMAVAGGFTGWFSLAAQPVAGAADQMEMGAASFAAALTGSGTITISVPTSATMTTDTEATIQIFEISVGPTADDRDSFDAATLGLVVSLNPPVVVIEPTLTASTGTDFSLDMGTEVTLGASFTDNAGAAGAGQSIAWAITNNGGETVSEAGGATMAAGATVTVTTATDAAGAASITLVAEGGDDAASTSVSVAASTSATNSDGVSRDLSVDYSATWDVPVPAELASFAGRVTVDREVLLSWGVASQTSNLGWEVLRSVDESVFERVGELVHGEGTTDVFHTYEFVDSAPPAADVVYYYLRQVDLDGSASRSDVIEVVFAPAASEQRLVPTVSALAQNYPNPFNPETTIQFDLSEGAAVSLTIYDVTGQAVRTLIGGEFVSAGSYSLLWDGRSSYGVQVASGVYFYELRAGEYNSMMKMTLLR